MSRDPQSPAPAGPAGTADELTPRERLARRSFLVGLFLPVQSSGWSFSSLPRSTTWRFEYIRTLVQRAEALDFDLVFGLAQWLKKDGYGGDLAYRGTSLDPFITTAALASATQRIALISTVHTLYGLHPVQLAKYGATLDHITGGRWGANLITGHRTSEWGIFGKEEIEHDLRYDMLGEFTEFLEALWLRDENLNRTGRFWSAADAYITPRPVDGRPILVTAGTSPASIAYAARHADLMFITSPGGAEIDAAVAALPALTGAVHAQAAAQGRRVRPIINPLIICRDTEREARATYDAILAHGDVEAAQRSLARGDTKSWAKHTLEQRIVGGNVQLIGSPEQVAEGILRLRQAGCDGIQVSFFDFEPDLEHFGRRVLPLLAQAGLRNFAGVPADQAVA
ncbi:LLM class flavin-dependent oxidoreductase [Ancylobacter sonchi]|uniref:LLM class flavin-dependent oxidoreductase n=1 Tax=Ancylobacter sonchi TaxID=1937790 RepID=UPI001BD23714|nr:LLM class flavin-dependent oxidoreductase [Ancylobacter sonchi]MBS7535990.1 LLM class flavin-dependent oxidoreductase [Ancylobacter sonchi]